MSFLTESITAITPPSSEAVTTAEEAVAVFAGDQARILPEAASFDPAGVTDTT